MSDEGESTEAFRRIIGTYVEMIHQSNPRGALKAQVCGALKDDGLPEHYLHVCWVRDVHHTRTGPNNVVHPHVCPCSYTWSKMEDA